MKYARKRSAAPFANAILRKLAENPRIHNDLQPMLAAADPEALAKTSAHPLWLVERWIGQFGVEITARISAFNQTRPVTAIRLLDSKADEEFRDEGIEIAPGSLLANARRVINGDITKSKQYADDRLQFKTRHRNWSQRWSVEGRASSIAVRRREEDLGNRRP